MFYKQNILINHKKNYRVKYCCIEVKRFIFIAINLLTSWNVDLITKEMKFFLR